jgi:hypothetical protein
MRVRVISIVCLLASAACTKSTESEPAGPAGSLTLSLVATSLNGDQFRLRNATFDIGGCAENYPGYPFGVAGAFASNAGAGGGYVSNCTTVSVSSEDDLDATTITKRLVPGYYNVTLEAGWYLEQASPSGWNRVEKVVLLSPISQSTYVWENGVSQVFYAFGAGGDLIDFRHGDVQIGIQVEHPGDNNCFGGTAGIQGWVAGGGACLPIGGGSAPIAGSGAQPVAGAGFIAN